MRLSFALCLAILLAGCGRDAAPTAPQAASVSLESASLAVTKSGKLDDLWPNDNGHSWSYDLRYNQAPFGILPFPRVYPTPEQVPPVPKPEDVVSYLGEILPVGTLETADYGLAFDGMTTTQSGATGQNLVETAELTKGTRTKFVSDFRARFLAQVARARPDLRNAIRALDDTIPPEVYFTPLLLHGGAWEKTAEYIGTYGDLDRDLAWLYLKADTRQGATFRLQLIKEIASDVYLNGWIVPRRLRDSHGKAVQVIYVIDYGISQATDQSGNLIGYLASTTYGSVTYVPGIGPVSSVERFATTDDLAHPVDEISTNLRSSGSVLAAR